MQRSRSRFRYRSAIGSGRRIAATALAPALAGVVVACGGGSDGDTPRAGLQVGAQTAVICPGVDARRLDQALTRTRRTNNALHQIRFRCPASNNGIDHATHHAIDSPS